MTHVTATVEGSQTDVGYSANVVTAFTLWNGTQNVTAFFPQPVLVDGVLTVTVSAAEITITASSAEKEYDGTPLVSDEFTTSDLPPGVTRVTTTVVGSQTDVGESENVVVVYTLWNGDQDVTDFFPNIVLEEGTLTINRNTTVITITEDSDEKQFDGMPLINDGFTTSDLPSGVTRVTAVVVGTQTDVGASPNAVTGYTLWNGDQDVTMFFAIAERVEGTLTVTPNTTLVTITADSDEKPYDGTPLINDGFTTSELPPGVTHVTAVVEGTQTDVGSSPNLVTSYRIWNGEQDVTAFFAEPELIEGTLTVTASEEVVVITADNDDKEYDGTPLVNDGYTTSDLPRGITRVEAVVEGSQTDVGNSPNVVTSYILWNGTQDVTSFFPEACS